MVWASDYDTNLGNANRTLKAHQEWLKQIDRSLLKIIGEVTLEGKLNLIIERLQKQNL